MRALALAVAGWVCGVGLTAALLWGTHQVLARLTAPRVLEVEHGVVYLGLVLGSGFGALCGAVVARNGGSR